jgi:hypothetical protein
MSIDYNISRKLAINILIDLYNSDKETKSTVNFLTGEITPGEAKTKQSIKLVKNYLEWLPEHFKAHNCNLNGIEKLEVTIWTDFDKSFSPQGMNDTTEFTVHASTKWKAKDREEQIIELTQVELIKKVFLKLRVRECQ